MTCDGIEQILVKPVDKNPQAQRAMLACRVDTFEKVPAAKFRPHKAFLAQQYLMP